MRRGFALHNPDCTQMNVLKYTIPVYTMLMSFTVVCEILHFSFPLKSGIFFDWIIILIWIFFVLSNRFVFHLIPKIMIPDTVIYILSSEEVKNVSLLSLVGIFLIMWPEQKKFNFFLSFERQFYNKKTNPHFCNSECIYVCTVKNRYFEFCHKHDFYFVWKGLMFNWKN